MRFCRLNDLYLGALICRGFLPTELLLAVFVTEFLGLDMGIISLSRKVGLGGAEVRLGVVAHFAQAGYSVSHRRMRTKQFGETPAF